MARRSTQAALTAGMLLAGLAVASPAHADTPVACSETDLRNAISAAAVGDTLSLTSYCVYTLTDAGGGELLITKNLNFTGNHATIKRDPTASDFRIFEVDFAALSLDTLTVMNGDATGGSGGGVGGGVYVAPGIGSLTGTNVNFQGNNSSSGGAIAAYPGTTVSLTGGTISDNRTNNSGGGIHTLLATLTLDSVTMTRNRADTGGGIDQLGGTGATTITNSTISHNTADIGGGGIAYVAGGALSVTGTTITDNRVTASQAGGGGILFDPDAGGTGTITGSTISGNTVIGAESSPALGGGINSRGGTLTVDSSTVKGNQVIGASSQGAGIAAEGIFVAGTLTLQNGTAVTGNLASGRYSQGGGLYTTASNQGVTVAVNASAIDGNKVTGTGSVSGGVYNVGGTYSFTTSSVDDNIAPLAPAPGGVYTTVAISTVDGATTFTGNTPTNCLLSPATVTNCVN